MGQSQGARWILGNSHVLPGGFWVKVKVPDGFWLIVMVPGGLWVRVMGPGGLWVNSHGARWIMGNSHGARWIMGNSHGARWIMGKSEGGSRCIACVKVIVSHSVPTSFHTGLGLFLTTLVFFLVPRKNKKKNLIHIIMNLTAGSPGKEAPS